MNTPSHLIINAALRKRANAGGALAIPRSAFLLGAVLPDIPLWLLWIGAYVYYRYVLGDMAVTPMDPRFDQLYFTNPFWIAAHNLLHAPTLLLIVLGVLWRGRAMVGSRRHWWFWFAAGCLMHTALDIPTHADDGPVLFFPFEWSIRFHSPMSYWDQRHFGRQFAIFELGLDLVLLAYLVMPWLVRRMRGHRSDSPPQEPHP
ncbi:metal-dependent hydrolase [Chloroflexales bacterium ZM16-3]|nr:metal-dependent hydrolase [Chloroflexales bacterium ZM16-3]